MTGFQSWTKYEKALVKLKQFYDFTYHLYNKEVDQIHQLLVENKQTIHTSIGSISHSVNSLYQYTKLQYPQKLREMVLISLISTTEVFFIRLIKEIYNRDKTIFGSVDVVELSKNELFNAQTINNITDRIINQELRSLTSGGILHIQKYYLKKLGVEFNTLTSDLSKYIEYFDRRHLFVHANGIIDNTYLKKYSKGKIGERIIIEHKYIDDGFTLFKKLGLSLRDKALIVCPDSKRLTTQKSGGCQFEESNIYYTELICRCPLDTIDKIKTISVDGLLINSFIIKYVISDTNNLKIFLRILDKHGFKVLQEIKKLENSSIILTTRIT